MLVELAVCNLGVIEQLRLTLAPGMTALTGETGAGKTMLVEAIALLSGGRPDPTRVRPGSTEAVIEGLFALDDREVVVRRVVPATGRSRAYIDGSLATAAAVEELVGEFIELHGQHAGQLLLSARHQRAALDRFAGVDAAALRAARREVAELRRRIELLGGDERARAREIDLLRYQLEEIASVSPEPGEESALEALEDALADAVAHRDAAAACASLLTDDGGAVELVGRAVRELSGRRPFIALEERLRSVFEELADLGAEVRATGEGIEPDEQRLETVRARRQALVELRRKYGDSIEAVLAFAQEAAARLDELGSHEARTTALEAELVAAIDRLDRLAAEVGAARRAAAPRLAEQVGGHLADLALPHARLEVEVADDPEREGAAAGDVVTFLFAANPGATPAPLARVASGGELSRTMLALRLVLSDGPPTMIFDEVDAGLGGAAAVAVGRALGRLATERQVLVVTHLPQVAAYAGRQCSVVKSATEHATTTRIELLDDQQRIEELSRMLSGSTRSDAARANAVELVATARADIDGLSVGSG